MNSQSGERQGENEAEKRQNSAPTIKSDKGEVSANPTNGESQQTSRSAYWEKRQYWVQATIAAVGAISVVIYSCQLHEMRKSTDAATNAAKATEESVKLARSIADRDQRPWVTVIASQLLEGPTAQSFPKVKLELVNSGKTPALNTQVFGSVFFNVMVWPEDVPSGVEGKAVSKMTIAPTAHSTAEFQSHESLTLTGVQMIESGLAQIYVTGVIEYMDTAGTKYKTRFCFRIGGTALDDEKRLMQACSVGNTAE